MHISPQLSRENENKTVVLIEEIQVGILQKKKLVKKGPRLSMKRQRVNIGHITKGR